MRKAFVAIFAISVVSVFWATADPDLAGAVKGGCYFSSKNDYITGTDDCKTVSDWGDYAVNDVFTGRGTNGSGSAIPEDEVDSKEGFITYVVDRFNGSNTQDKIGAAFVIQKMRGSKSWPTTADVEDWRVRMLNPQVSFSARNRASVASSSWYDPTSQNVFTANRDSTRNIIEIMYDGKVIIQVIRVCGNPTALQQVPLPTEPESWAISSESRLHVPAMTGTNGQWLDARSRPTQTVTVGQTITFWHNLKNIGNKTVGGVTTYVQTYSRPDISPQGMALYEVAPNDDTWGSSWVVTLMGGKRIAADRQVYYHPTHSDTGSASLSRVAAAADIDKFVCQRISTISAEGSSVWQYSAPACVKVVAAPPPPPPKWTVTGASSVNMAEASPDQTVKWTHRLSLTDGPTNAGISRSIVKSDGWSGTESLSAIGQPWSLATRSNPYENVWTHIVTQDDVGKRLCQNIRWSPRSSSNAAANSSAAACVVVPYNFDLTPSLSTSASYAGGAVEANANVRIDRTVSNGGRTKSRNAEWQMVEFVVRQGSAIPGDGGGTGAQNPCAWFGPTATGCTSIDGGTDRVFTTGLTSLTPPSERNVPDLDVGDRICWALSVSPYDHTPAGARWRHSTPYCLTVGKKPKVQFWGADVRTVGSVTTSQSINGENKMYGSWAEYAIMSARQVVSSSGAGLSSSDTGRNLMSNALDYNKLTFANTTSPYGNFATPRSAEPTRPANLEVRPAPSSMGFSDGTESGVYESSGDVEIGEGVLKSGRVVYVEARGTVRITGNVTYEDGPYSSADSLPQLVIKARNIVIEQDVGVVDAWLVASSGYVSTCGSVSVSPSSSWTTGLSSESCNGQLRVNGPIMADRLYLRRTHGADVVHRGSPAEILNMRPDTYLWGKASASRSTSIGTQHLKELPPRF